MILFLLMMAGGSVMLHGQMTDATLVNHDTLLLCFGENFDHRFNHIMHDYYQGDPFDGWAVLGKYQGSFTVNYTVNTNFSTEALQGYVDIWDGDTVTGTLHHIVDRTTSSITITSGLMTLHVHYDRVNVDSPRRNFVLRCSSILSAESIDSCSSAARNLRVENITTTEATICWSGTASSYHVTVGDQGYTVADTSLHLTGLTPNTGYPVRIVPSSFSGSPCCIKKKVFYTDPIPHIGCPNILDLHSDYVRCFYGTFDNPYANVGIVYTDPSSVSNRHTVHTDTAGRDYGSGRVLHSVGPGLPGSVQLGNRQSNKEAEAITYYLHIDTLLYSLIMLHYAVVLENPEHTAYLQPRFTMQVLDQNDSVIDAQCGAADFIADSSLGWNNGPGQVLWKDWTTIGINLAPYHGQDVRLRLTTYDCGGGAHFGYAYFYAECQQPFASSDHCGVIDTVTLTAPDGFNYLWYQTSPSNPISTSQSVTYSSAEGSVYCQLSFLENPSCYLTMNTYVSNFWPQAIIDTFLTVDHGCDGYEVQFLNRSTILGDDSLALPGNPPCETASWFFGDGYRSLQYSPSHTYRHPGTYTVTLISGLAGNQCTDTTTFTITAPDAWAPSDQYLSCCDSLLWIDSVWYYHDTVGPTKRIEYPLTCDTVYMLHLSTLPSSYYTLPVDTFCYSGTYSWRGIAANHSPHSTLIDTITAANGCDSILFQPVVCLQPDPLTIDINPDCGLGYYLLTAVTDNPYWLWTSSPHDTSIDGHEHDRKLQVFPIDSTTYSLTSFYDSLLFCPTTITQTLSQPSFPHADLDVISNILSFDHPNLIAIDRSKKYSQRQWAVIYHDGGDTVFLPDTLRRISYPVNLDADSATVMLTVSSGLCFDTASQTLPIIRYGLFAPNVFTPDESINNRFFIVCDGALEAQLTIYNRQGLLVFSADNLNQEWDGTHDGTPCPQGAYVWHLLLRTVDAPDGWTSHLGTVTLLR